jgi:hypothetical protein
MTRCGGLTGRDRWRTARDGRDEAKKLDIAVTNALISATAMPSGKTPRSAVEIGCYLSKHPEENRRKEELRQRSRSARRANRTGEAWRTFSQSNGQSCGDWSYLDYWPVRPARLQRKDIERMEDSW